jgi:hypothetical protein
METRADYEPENKCIPSDTYLARVISSNKSAEDSPILLKKYSKVKE